MSSHLHDQYTITRSDILKRWYSSSSSRCVVGFFVLFFKRWGGRDVWNIATPFLHWLFLLSQRNNLEGGVTFFKLLLERINQTETEKKGKHFYPAVRWGIYPRAVCEGGTYYRLCINVISTSKPVYGTQIASRKNTKKKCHYIRKPLWHHSAIALVLHGDIKISIGVVFECSSRV